MLILDGSAGSDHGPGQHMIVLKGELRRGEGESIAGRGSGMCGMQQGGQTESQSHSCV